MYCNTATIVRWKIACDCWFRLCSIISGFILIKSVMNIKKFFKEHNAENFINLPVLMRHAAAFGLYLIGTSVMGIVGVWFGTDFNRETFEIYSWFFMAEICIEFVSGMLLCEILWPLGTKTEVEIFKGAKAGDQNEPNVVSDAVIL